MKKPDFRQLLYIDQIGCQPCIRSHSVPATYVANAKRPVETEFPKPVK